MHKRNDKLMVIIVAVIAFLILFLANFIPFFLPNAFTTQKVLFALYLVSKVVASCGLLLALVYIIMRPRLANGILLMLLIGSGAMQIFPLLIRIVNIQTINKKITLNNAIIINTFLLIVTIFLLVAMIASTVIMNKKLLQSAALAKADEISSEGNNANG